MHHTLRSVVFLACTGCGAASGDTGWAGSMDTLPSGMVVVTNPEQGIWQPGAEWQVMEEIRIGSAEGDGPETLGQISSLLEDDGGRIWALEAAEQQFKVFGPAGEYIRTVGRKGGGPGEMRQVAGVAIAPDGRIVVVDPQGARISQFDTSGAFLKSLTISGGFAMFPWPGGIDTAGYLYNVVPRPDAEVFGVALVRYDSAMTPLDTLIPPTWDKQDYFDHRSKSGSVRASVPYSPSMDWKLTRAGDFWMVLTGTYQLYRQSGRGDTLRKVTKPFQTLPVTAEEKDSALSRLRWFTSQGGSVDRGRIPDTKPPVRGLLVDEAGYLWVNPAVPDTSVQRRTFDIFDPEGRYLGRLQLPFDLTGYPEPVLRRDRIIAVTQNVDGVPYIVRARLDRR